MNKLDQSQKISSNRGMGSCFSKPYSENHMRSNEQHNSSEYGNGKNNSYSPSEEPQSRSVSKMLRDARRDKEIISLRNENEHLKKTIKKNEEDLKSLKDKVANEVALSIKTGKTESLNNPVSQTRLKELYDDLRCRWPKIKRLLKSNKKTPPIVKQSIEEAFKKAQEEVTTLSDQIDSFIGVGKRSNEDSQKARQHKQSAVQDLQQALYFSRIEGHVSKISVQTYTDVKPEDLMEDLLSECNWLGRLMALNNPPLQPDWTHHMPGMDAWHILPRNFRCIKKKKSNQTSKPE